MSFGYQYEVSTHRCTASTFELLQESIAEFMKTRSWIAERVVSVSIMQSPTDHNWYALITLDNRPFADEGYRLRR